MKAKNNCCRNGMETLKGSFSPNEAFGLKFSFNRFSDVRMRSLSILQAINSLIESQNKLRHLYSRICRQKVAYLKHVFGVILSLKTDRSPVLQVEISIPYPLQQVPIYSSWLDLFTQLISSPPHTSFSLKPLSQVWIFFVGALALFQLDRLLDITFFRNLHLTHPRSVSLHYQLLKRFLKSAILHVLI